MMIPTTIEFHTHPVRVYPYTHGVMINQMPMSAVSQLAQRPVAPANREAARKVTMIPNMMPFDLSLPYTVPTQAEMMK